MVFEQAAKLIPRIAPEVGEASTRLLAETIPAMETGIKAYFFGGAKSNAGNAGKLANIHFPQNGPVWNEEVLFRHSQQVELGEELLFGEATAAELKQAKTSAQWLENAGFEFNSFKPYFTNKRLATGEGTMSPNVMRRLTEGSQNTMEGSTSALSRHYFRDNNGQAHLMDIYDTKGAAERLGYARRTVQELAYTGKVPAHMVQGDHGLEWRILLPAEKSTAQVASKPTTPMTEELLFRKAANGDPSKDFFRMPIWR